MRQIRVVGQQEWVRPVRTASPVIIHYDGGTNIEDLFVTYKPWAYLVDVYGYDHEGD